MVSYTPLLPPQSGIYQQLVTLDTNNIKILFDVGWDHQLQIDVLNPLIEQTPHIDLILLTHATISHAGAFVYLRYKYPEFRKIPVYATFPVVRLGQIMTAELYRGCGLSGPFDDPNSIPPLEIENIWSEVFAVNYSQPITLHNHLGLENISITAYNSGHTLGGTLWKVEDKIDSLLVALDWNHARDAHLSGAFLDPKNGKFNKDLQTPSLLITSTSVCSTQSFKKSREEFLAKVGDALAKGGTVLIPTSTGARDLELVLLLDTFLSQSQEYKSTPLIYCSYTGQQAMREASSMLEWMVPSIITDWQVQNKSPFETRNVHYVSSVLKLKTNWTNGPRIVLASGEWLESGLSKQVFLDVVAENPQSTLLFTEFCPPNTLGGKIMQFIKAKEIVRFKTELSNVECKVETPLSGRALTEYRERLAAERERAELVLAQEKRNQELIDTSAAQEESSDSDEDLENNDSSTLATNALLYSRDIYDYQCEPNSRVVFPFSSKRRKRDEYGEQIPNDFYTYLEKRDNEDKRENAEQDYQLGGSNSAGSASSNSNGSNKRLLNGFSTQTILNTVEDPMKVLTETKSVKPVCFISYADMNGLTNERSLEMILKQIKAAKITAIPSFRSSDVCEKLAKQFENFHLGDTPVSYARTNFAVDVRIDPLVKLKWHNLSKEYSIARIEGQLEFDQHDQTNNHKSSASLVPARQSHLNENSQQPLTIGDLRLNNLRRALVDQGINAEFHNTTTLVCDDKVFIKQVTDGKFLLEGGIDQEYYQIRKIMRSFITTM